MMDIKALPPTGPIQEPWRALNEPAQIIQALQRQRDQLLEALEKIRPALTSAKYSEGEEEVRRALDACRGALLTVEAAIAAARGVD